MPTRKDNTNVAPIHREQQFIPFKGAKKILWDSLPKINEHRIGSGAIDIVSPEFDLLTGIRGINSLFDNIIGRKLPSNYAYRRAGRQELDDIISTKSFRKIPDNVEIEGGRTITLPNGKIVTFKKAKGNSHKGKAFAAGEPWKGTTSSGNKSSEIIIGVPGNNAKWKVGHHGSYTQPMEFNKISKGEGLFVPFDDNGVADISIKGLKKFTPTRFKNRYISQDIEMKCGGRRKARFGLEDGVPTQEEYIAQQIAAKKAAALDKSRNRTSVKVPMVLNQISEDVWRDKLRKDIESSEEFLSRAMAEGNTRSANFWKKDLDNLLKQEELGYPIMVKGSNCMYNAGDCYGLNIPGNLTFAAKHKKLGFQKAPKGSMEPGDIVQDVSSGKPLHAMIYDSKDSKGNLLFNYARGRTGEDNAFDMNKNYVKQGKYVIPIKDYDVYKYVGTPADSTQWINEYKQRYGNGMRCGGRRKAEYGLDIQYGGRAIPIGRNMVYFDGNSHDDGGIGVGNKLEVEGGEVGEYKNNTLRVFSSVPFLQGFSPAQLVMGGANPNKVFKAQENFKDKNRINDDGTIYEMGGEGKPKSKRSRPVTGILPYGYTIRNLYAVENPYRKGIKGNVAKMYDNRTLGAGVDVISGHPELYKKAKSGKMSKKQADETAVIHLRKDDNAIRSNYADVYGKAAADTLSYGPRFLVAQARYQQGNVRKAWQPIHKAMAKGDAKALKKAVLQVTPKDHEYRRKWIEGFKVYKMGGMIYTINGNVKNGLMSVRHKAQYGTEKKINANTKIGEDGLIYTKAIDGDWYTDGTRYEDSKYYMGRKSAQAYSREKFKRQPKPQSLDEVVVTGTRPKVKEESKPITISSNNGNTITTQTIEGKQVDYPKTNTGYKPFTYKKDKDGKLVKVYDDDKRYNNSYIRPNREGANYKPNNYNPLTGEIVDEQGIVETSEPSIIGTTKVSSSTSSTPRGRGTKQPKATASTKPATVETKQPKLVERPKENLYITGVKNNAVKSPFMTGMEKISTNRGSSSTGGGTQPKDGNWIPQYNLITGRDWLGVGTNLAGHIASYFANRDILDRYPMPTKPVMAPAVKLKRRVNINPELTNSKEAELMGIEATNRNTSSSNTSLARNQRIMNESRDARNKLYAYKENAETQLINQDNLNRQGVYARNVAAHNDWLNKTYVAKTNKLLGKQQNLMGLINGIPMAVNNVLGNIESRKSTNDMIHAIAAANPNVDGRLLGIGDYYTQQLGNGKIAKYNKNHKFIKYV